MYFEKHLQSAQSTFLQANEAGSGHEELQSVLSDLHAKVEELEEAIQEVEKTKNTLRAAFQSAIGTAPSTASAPPANVMDLGVVGQGKKRINLAPTAPASGRVAKIFCRKSSHKCCAKLKPRVLSLLACRDIPCSDIISALWVADVGRAQL